MGTPKLEKTEEKPLIPITENRTKLQLDIVGSPPIDSIPAESPEIQHNQDVRSSSRSEGRFFLFYFLIHYNVFFLLLH